MPEDVLEILRKIIENHSEVSDNNDKKAYSENYIKMLDTNRRIQLETWS